MQKLTQKEERDGHETKLRATLSDVLSDPEAIRDLVKALDEKGPNTLSRIMRAMT